MIGSETRASLVAASLALAVMSPRAARADDKAAAAEVLFEEAKRLVAAGDFARACPKLEESQKLDPGLGTLYRLADCYEHVGRTASAWAAFREVTAAAKSSGQAARADDAKKRADALEPSLARCEIRVDQPDTPGLVVKRGATEIGRGQWGTLVPVDPGETVVEASAPGRKPFRMTTTVVARATTRFEIPALEVLPEPPPGAPRGPAMTEGPRALGESPRERDVLSAQQKLGLAAGVAGVVGLGVGTAFGIVSMSKKSDADTRCDAANTCDDAGLGLRKDAIAAGNVSTVAFVVGSVLVAGGAVLWFTAPKSASGLRAGLAPRGLGAGLVVEVP